MKSNEIPSIITQQAIYPPLQNTPDEQEYLVEKIIGKRIENGKEKFRVKWLGFPLSQCTWEPIENLKNVIPLIEDYKLNEKKTKSEKLLKRKRKDKLDVSDVKVINKETKVDEKKPIAKDTKNYRVKDIFKIDRNFNAVVEIEENSNNKILTLPTSALKVQCPELLIDFYENKFKQIFNLFE